MEIRGKKVVVICSFPNEEIYLLQVINPWMFIICCQHFFLILLSAHYIHYPASMRPQGGTRRFMNYSDVRSFHHNNSGFPFQVSHVEYSNARAHALNLI